MRDLIFVDTETTGLADDPEAEVWEVTWARIDEEPRTLWFGFTEVPEFIDKLTKFTERNCAGKRSEYFEFEEFMRASKNNTMLAANPAHDQHFLKLAGIWNFHYRMLDIESYAMAKLDLYYVPSMKDIYDILSASGHKITEPDHSSRNDVLAMRDAYIILRDEY